MTKLERSQIPNIITATRIVALPVLWVLAAQGRTQILAVVLAVVISTDLVDGTLARWFDARSDLGSRLDSIADHMLTASVVIWLVWLEPEFIAENARVLLAWLALGLVTLAVGWARFRRIGDLHLYSAKAAMTLGYIFVVLLLYRGDYEPWFFAVTIGACFVGTGETLLVYLTRGDGWERPGSVFSRRG